MSRIIVKSLPKKITEENLRELFSEKGDVTDVQLKYNSEGKFRCFAFVGFRSDEQANNAREYFNNTYVQNCKIKIEICKTDEQQNKNLNSEENVEIKKTVKEEFEDLKEDAEFLEFLKVQRNVGHTKKIWSDDVILSAMAKKYLKSKETNENQEENKTKKGKEKVKPETIFKYTIAIRKIPKNQRTKKSIKEFFKPLKPISIRIPKIKTLAYVSFKTESEFKQALDKHKSFMGKNQVDLQVLKTKDPKESNIQFNKHKGRLEKHLPVENIDENGRLFIRNLSYQCTVEDLETLFNKYGPTTEINLPIDTMTQKIKGFAFVTYVFPEHAKQAYNELDRSTFQGRLLHIIPAETKERDFNERFNYDESSSFKKSKNLKLQTNSTKSASSWNTLFLGQNAIANILSKKMEIEKSQFFQASKNESLAARMALGETQLVNETRMFLENNGVFLNCFDIGNLKRSKTTFLIKHLPSNTSENELKEFLSVHGQIKRLILPPSCITAIVEMDNQQVAYDTFKKLAYKKFKNIPLYLEWAPINVLDKNVTDVMESKAKEPKTKKLKKLEYAIDDELNEDDSKANEQTDKVIETMNEFNETTKTDEKNKKTDEILPKQKSYKILVKNVPFEASIKDVRQLFSAFGDLQFVRLPKKLHGTGSHRGFAFVEYVNQADARRAFE